MSYIFLQEQGEESSVECFSDIPAFVLSRSMLTAGNHYSNVSGMESFPDSRSGTMSPLSMESPGEELPRLFVEDFPALTLVQPEKEQGSMGKLPAFGPSSSESFVKWDRESFSWKIPHCLPLAGLNEFLGTWPRWGLMLNGECWEQPISSGVTETRSRITNAIEFGFLRYPTPRANDGEKRGNFDVMNPRNGFAGFVRRYPTPTCHMAKEGGYSAELRRNTPTMGAILGGKPNPEYAEWLMGWPIGWTDLKPLAMDKFRVWLRSHGIS